MNLPDHELERSIRFGLRSVPNASWRRRMQARQYVLVRAANQALVPSDLESPMSWLQGLGHGWQSIRRGLTALAIEAGAYERANAGRHAMLVRQDMRLRVCYSWGSLCFGMTLTVY